MIAARAFIDAGTEYLGVAQPDDAFYLRQNGILLSDVKILTWLVTPSSDIELLLKNEIEISVGNFMLFEKIIKIAKISNSIPKIQIKLDIESGRDGFTPGQCNELLNRIYENKNILDITGAWGHFVMADEPADESNLKLGELVIYISNILNDLGYKKLVRHISNSTALLTLPKYKLDMVRPASFCFGLSSDDNSIKPKELGLIPVMKIFAEMAVIKNVYKGEGISYGHGWKAPVDTKIAVVYFGYSDGFPANNTNKLYVYSPKDNQKYKIVGAICMDQIFVEIGNNSSLSAGDTIEIFGDEPCLIGDLAKNANMLHANILSNLKSNAPRQIIHNS
jgi:alanine racemase